MSQREYIVARCLGCGAVPAATEQRAFSDSSDWLDVFAMVTPGRVVLIETHDELALSSCTCAPDATPVPALDVAALLTQLAESQAREAALREAMETQEPVRCLAAFEDAPACGKPTCGPCARVRVRALPADATALNEVRAQVWEEAARDACEYCRQGWAAIQISGGTFRHFPEDKQVRSSHYCAGSRFLARAAALRKGEA